MESARIRENRGQAWPTTFTPMLRAVPSTVLIASSREAAFRSGGVASAI